ncbi:MAG: glycerol-3-phosphate 1-O-acyltransferase PlsY [Chloroflexota bacterium]
MNLIELTAVVVSSYLVGAIPIGYLMVKAVKHDDIRNYGSRNVGATNVLRVLGTRWFVACMILDAAKGYVPTLVAWYIFHTHDMQVAAGIAAVLGHDFPVFIHFKGGRGVATSFGVFAALALPIAVGMVAVGVFIVLALRHMSVMSMVTVPGGAIVLFLLAASAVNQDDFTYTKSIFGAFATFFVLVTHIPNIRRLIKGTEPRFGDNEPPRAPAHPRTT